MQGFSHLKSKRVLALEDGIASAHHSPLALPPETIMITNGSLLSYPLGSFSIS
jgi:hypothetical protein